MSVRSGHSRLGVRNATHIKHVVDGLIDGAGIADVLVATTAARGAFTFEGPSETDVLVLVLGDDVSATTS